ncbi:MAG: alpha-mannosidase, partial [Candidatus Eremiobacteraeota bacterium]|nr:alpha-mannosidase [Candidatus Eremiobacteraeota bacterium]
GHSHLDVAWLWTYGETRRKAVRTFAIAVNLLERHPQFRFAQSQPQLYEFVRETDADLFERVRTLVAARRFDASVAALWVESDCNLPSGESLLRQLLYARHFCVEHFNEEPQVAWLPDSFGFANTLPMVLTHAGISYFATTKLQWNDTTRFPHAQFRWRGPDGSEVTAALIDSYDGGLSALRVARARRRHEPIVAGYGDGGGGVTEAMIAQAHHVGKWVRPVDWLQSLERNALPVHDDELYLEYHRGVFTTHHDVKQRNASLERLLGEAEAAVSLCVAIHHDRSQIAEWCRKLDRAWKLVLRNQFHDVLTGTSIGAVYGDVHKEYDEADALIASVLQGAYLVVKRAERPKQRRVAPKGTDAGAFLFANSLVEARVTADAIVDMLQVAGGSNLVSQANVLTLYRDRPRQWDAWNIDADYRSARWTPRARDARIEDGALRVTVSFGRSSFEMQVSLREGEPFLRVDFNGEWRERHTLLRCESLFHVEADRVIYGSPHGTIERSALSRTAQDRAKFEVPGQRFAFARSAQGGIAMLALDTYGWSARRQGEGLQLGHSLLRSPMWPQQDADAGRQQLSYAFAPTATASIGEVEQLWRRFADQPPLELFSCDDKAVVIAACKPAQDGDGVILRIRECEGESREAFIYCLHAVESIERVDGLERSREAQGHEVAASMQVNLRPFALQSYRIRF